MDILSFSSPNHSDEDISVDNIDPQLFDSETIDTGNLSSSFAASSPPNENHSTLPLSNALLNELQIHSFDGSHYVEYRDEYKEKFFKWWHQTQVGLQIQQGINLTKQAHPQWSSQNRSEIWKEFRQLAHTVTGTPKVQCIYDGMLLTHPTYKKYGPSGLLKHWNNSKCKRPKSLGKPDYKVSYLIIYYFSENNN